MEQQLSLPAVGALLMEYDLDLEAFDWDQERCLTTAKQTLAPFYAAPNQNCPIKPTDSTSLSVDSFSPPTASFTSPDIFSSDESLLYDSFTMTPSEIGSILFLPYSVPPTALPRSAGGMGGLCNNDDDCDVIGQRQATQKYTVNSENLNPHGEKRPSPTSQETEQPPASRLQNGNVDASAEIPTGIKLRTTSRKPKEPPSKKLGGDKVPFSPSAAQPRHSHNLAEKQYRNRLNQQFNNLLAALPAPPSEDCDCHDIGNRRLSKARCLSKARVMDHARQRIKSLERENQALVKERDKLMKNINLMQEMIK
ncbi:hypothetical protein BGZ61DRAFT_523896 [Ilyonectria robusta]|uniref:uncharacterized protein n=1 Tax=Ilyonectria robusta TaxID=1079257 RepID=UPI001E8E86A5|nr:uncharacterized protein BGZ61DRAFT_523896 [Ilyonectria robusta]KAH8656731.1 hypothetical protein BGZ61DRAFT_523896 [Ilyonectria robusta]